MPEGDTLFRTARTLDRALAGRVVTGFTSVYATLTRVDADAPIAGRTVDRVFARGKHLLMAFSGDLLLHTHLRMSGSWHIYQPGERWRAPRADMRIVIITEAYEAVGFNVPVAEFLTPLELARHPQISALGPDLTDTAFDRDDVRRRLATVGELPIEQALLNQRVLAGIGNELKSEVLFVARVHPFTPSSAIDDTTFARLMDAAQKLMRMNIVDRTLSPTFGRRTTGSMDPRATVFVYGRGGKACRRCGEAIEVRKSGADARLTYWCPGCQGE